MEEIKIELDEDISFNKAVELAKAVLLICKEPRGLKFVAWWDNADGDHEPVEWDWENFDEKAEAIADYDVVVNDEYELYFKLDL